MAQLLELALLHELELPNQLGVLRLMFNQHGKGECDLLKVLVKQLFCKHH
jgi:hypothetical protein